MKSWNKIYLLLISLMVFSQIAVAEGMSFRNSTAICSLPASAALPCVFASSPVDGIETAAGISLPETSATAESDSRFHCTFSKFKKRLKQIQSFSCKIKTPEKNIDTIMPLLYTQGNYSNPYFLSHLHSYLFRLTPF